MSSREDFFSAYFQYIGDTESPMTFHRWSAIATLGAWIGRSYYFQLGHFTIRPNVYCMLMGSAGSRKSTAIKIATKLIGKAGYSAVAAERTTKEKFLLDLAGSGDIIADASGKRTPEEIMEMNLFGGTSSTNHVPEILIAADEFNNFLGNGNIEFLSMLGVLWDFEGTFKNRVKNSSSVEIDNPYVSILAGNTPTGFSLAFPPEAIGQGIFSRIILVHGEPTGKKITIPVAPSTESVNGMVDLLGGIRAVANGEAKPTAGAMSLLDSIYQAPTAFNDVRFEAYISRRFTHLLKLCLVVSAAALRNTITESDVIFANTILTHAEHGMGKALGEFGKARHSDVAHKIIQILESSYDVVPLKQLWIQVHNDLEDMDVLKDMLTNLVMADKIISEKKGFLAKRKRIDEMNNGFVDFSLLHEEERKYAS